MRGHGRAFDLVVEGEESLSGQVEAVVGLQLAVGDVDEDPFLEIEQLEDGQGVSLAVDRAEVVAWELRAAHMSAVTGIAARGSG